MASNKQRFTYEINADIGQAKKAINDLQHSIEKLSKAQINTDYLDKGINNAVGAAKELQFHLNAALNQNTGKINLNAFTQSLQQSNTSAKDLMQTLLQGGVAGQQTFTALASAIAQSEVPLRQANKTLQDFATTLKNTVKWEISSTMVHGLESALSGAVSYAKNLNTSLTNIRIVTGQSVDDMARFAKEANVAAKALSTTTKSYTDASLIYYQQGDSQELAAKKAAITIKAANSSFETSAKEMSEYLTAVWNSYQVGADELERYVDIMANLGARTATSLEEIATSMQKVAATANTVGVSMEQVSSIIATVSSVTRESAESIGTSYKTIFARIGDLKLGNVDEDGVGLGQVSSQLDAIGVKILDGSGNLREMGDIIMDLGTKWQTMNQAQKTAVAQVVAGKRQYTQLMALFENWDMFQGNMNIAENSDGALQKMQDTYAESWEGASARAQTAIEGIYNTILNDQAIIKMINGLADLTTGLNNVIEGFGGLGGVITTLGGLATRVFKKQISSSIDDTLGKFTKWSSQFKGQDFFEIGKKIATGSAKSAEQIKHEDEQARWQSYMKDMKVSSESEGVALNNSAELLNMKERLIDAEYRLSDAQKSRAQYELSVLAQEQERLLTLTQEREELDKQTEAQDRQAKAEAARVMVKEGSAATNKSARDKIDGVFSSFQNIQGADTYEGALGVYRMNAEKIELTSIFAEELERTKGDAAETEKVLQKIKNIFGDEIEASLFDDAQQDATKLIDRLKEVQNTAEKTNEQLTTRMETHSGLDKETKDTMQKSFDNAYEEGKQRATLRIGEQGVSQNIGGIKQTLTDLFDADSAVSKSLGNTLATVADLGMSAAGAFYDGAEAIRIMNDESATLGDKLGLVASTATNLATSFAAGGPWGLALTAITMVISGIIQAIEEAKKVQAEDFNRLVEKGNEKDAEVSNIQTLVQNYNTLKETYETTGTGQEALAESARKLAEAYGIVGANVAIASGNFKEFERMIAQSSGLDKTERFYKDSADELRKELAANKRNNRSMYWDDTILDDNLSLTQAYRFSDVNGYTFANHIDSTAWDASRNKNTPLASSSFASDVRVEDAERQLMLLKYLDEQKTTTESKIGEYNSDLLKLANIQPNISGFLDNNPLQAYYDSIQVDERDTFLGVKVGTNVKETGTLTREQFMSQIDEGFNKTIQNYLGEVFYNEDGQTVYDFSQIADSAGQIIGDPITKMIEAYMKDFENENGTYTINQANLDKFYETSAALKQDWVNSIIKWVTDQKNLLSESLTTDYSESIVLAEDELYQAQKDREEAMRDATYEQLKESLAAQYNASGLTEIDYFDPLTDDQGYLTFATAEDKEAWYASMLEQQKAAQAEKDKVDAEIAKEEERLKKEGLKDSEWLQVLEYRQEMLSSMLTSFESLNDEDLTKLIKQVQDYDKSAHEISLITKTLSTMLGKSEANTKFNEFVDNYLPTVQTAIDEAASQYEELQPYLIKGEDGEYTNEVNKEFLDKYNAARDALALKFIDDWTSFDDFIYIYQDLAANFKDTNFDKVKDYISSKGTEIKDSSIINNALISAMKQDLNTTGEIGVNTARVRALNEQVVAGNKSVETYKNMQAQAGAYKDNLSYEDALALQETLFQEGTDEWAKFVAMDGDARKAYLEARAEQSRENAAEAQRLIAENAANEQKQFFKKEKAYEMAKSEVQNFFGTYMLDEKTGQYVNRTNSDDIIDADTGKSYEALQERVVNYEYWKGVEEEAENAARAFELLDSNSERAVTKIERMRSAISKLPSDMEEFNKLVAQLNNIDPKELINMSDLDRAKLILKELEKPTEDQFNVWDEETKKYVFNAAGYNEAMEAYEASRLEAVDVILASADAAFTQIENRMNRAREEAEKTKTIAEALSGAIETGELTETQKLGMSQTLVDDWGKASNATERAAIAAQQWANYGTEITNAGKDVADAYVAAGAALDKTIKDAKANNVTDLLTFNFSNKETGKTDFGEFIQNVVTDPALQAIWNKGFEDLISHTDISNMSDLGILEAVKAEIQKTGKVTEAEFDQILAGIKDSIIGMYSTLGEQEASLAQQVVEEWETAFKQIASLRRSIIMGDDIGSDLTTSLQDYIKYANAYTGQGSLAEAYKSGGLTANQISLASSEGLTEKLLASMGLANDQWEVYEGDDGFLYQRQTKDYYDLFDSKNGETVLKGIDALAAQFNISKIGKDEATYEKAVREAAAPFIRNLLSQSGLDATTVDAKVNEFLNGSITATSTINEAANKMVGIAGEYADLLASNQKIAEADAEFQATKTEQEKIQQEAQSYADVTESIMNLSATDKTAENIGNILTEAGISPENYLAQMRAQGFGEANSLSDIANMSYARLGEFESIMQQDAIEAGKTIVEAAETFKGIVTGEGFGENSVAMETANEYYETAQEGADILTEQERLDNIADYQTYNQMGVDQATNQLDSLAALDGMTAASDGWYQKIDDVAEAYKGLEGADAIIKKLRDGTIDLEEANDELVDITLDCVDSVETLTDEQWNAYKQSLRTNEVTIDGYETLEDYIDTVEDARKEWKQFQKSMEDSPDLLEDISDLAGDVVEEGEELSKIAQRLGEDEGFQELWKSLDPENADIDPATIMNIFNNYLANMAAGMDETTAYYTAICDQAAAAIESGNESLALRLLASAGITADNAQAAIDQIRAALASGQDLGSYTWTGNVTVDGNVNASPLANKIRSVINALRLMGMTVSGNIESGVSRLGNIGGGGGGGSRYSGGSGGSGGGGGEKKKETKELVRMEDEIERYHVQNAVLDRIADNLDEIDKLKERAYGKDHIAQIDAETDALNKQLIAQHDLHDEARKWMAADKADLEKYGAEYDTEGTIINYEQVMERIIGEYNSAIEIYNNSGQGDGDKLALEAAEQRFEDAKKSIENYEEALSVANDSANEMLEIQNKLSEIEVEKITYKLELKVNLNERDLELLQYYQDKYTETLDKQDEVYNTILGSMLEYEDNLKALGEAYEELNNKRALGLITEADYAEAVQDLQDQIIDNLSELNDIQNQLVDTYTETLALAREEVERTTDTIDSANTALQSYMEILALSGNEKDYEKMATFYGMMNENNLTKIEIQRNHLDALLEEEDKFQEKIRSGQQLTDLEKEQYQALQEEIFETRDALLSTTQEALNTIRETYENTINSISDNLDNFMADAAGSMAYLQEQYGYFQEEQERYVSTAKELYEVSKLNRDIEKTLGETTSKAAKEALKALQEKINKQSELNELTEYDIEMNQLQYQLLLARIKLEETQNAKDVVRLTRDENGNYAYRYTANQDKIDEAAQNYEDVLQQINDSTVQRTSEIEQQLLNTMSNYKEKFQEIATDYTLTEEERLMKLEELNNNFAETMQFIQEQNAIATENLTANQEAIAEHYGVNMSQITASTAGNVNETIQSMIDKTQDYINAMNEAIFGEEGGQTAWQKYLAGVGDITDAADVAYGTMIKDAEEMGEMNNWSAEQAQEVIDTLTDTLEPLEALTNAWNSHNAILEATISNYESLAEVIQGVLAAVGEIPNTTGTGAADGTSMPRFAKGGPVDYTGLAWVDGTPGNPEYVLNPGDTENILMAAAAVKSMDSGFLGSLVESVKSAAHAMMNIFSNAYHAVGGVHTASTTLDQNVHITAEFPNVTDHNEIEEALLSLTNRASQFANQKK